jgi:transcriptional regulator with XRE-family HTH domain
VIRSKRSEEIIQRIEYIRNYLGLNKSRFSTEIGLKPQTYNNFIGAQASKPSVELILGIVNRFGVNPAWLLNGSGPVFQERSAEQESAFGPAAGSAAPRAWSGQLAEASRPIGWGGAPGDNALNQQLARLTETVQSLEKRLMAVESPQQAVVREIAELASRLVEVDAQGADAELQELRARLDRLIAERTRR